MIDSADAAAADITHSTLLYKHFFPAWNPHLQDLLQHTCREQITGYRDATFSDPSMSYTVLDCLLKQFPEFRKVSFLPLPPDEQDAGPGYDVHR